MGFAGLCQRKIWVRPQGKAFFLAAVAILQTPAFAPALVISRYVPFSSESRIWGRSHSKLIFVKDIWGHFSWAIRKSCLFFWLYSRLLLAVNEPAWTLKNKKAPHSLHLRGFFVIYWTSLEAKKHIIGGGLSLLPTCLYKFPLTGKFTGNFDSFLMRFVRTVRATPAYKDFSEHQLQTREHYNREINLGIREFAVTLILLSVAFVLI